MYLNIQFSQEKFQGIILHYVRRRVLSNRNLGLGGIRAIPFDPLDAAAPAEAGVIDHITIDAIELDYATGAGAARDTSTINLPPLLLTRGRDFPLSSDLDISQLLALCNITVHVVRVADLEDAGLARSPDRVTTRFRVQVALKVTQPSISGGNLSIGFVPAWIGFGLGSLYVPTDDLDNEQLGELADDLLQVMRDNADEWFPPVTFPISNLDEAFGAGLRIWNAGLRKSGGVIDLQLQVDREDLHSTSATTPFGGWLDAWSTYFDASVISRLGSLDWGVFFPFEMFDRRIQDTVTSSLAGRADVVLNAAPTSTWHITNTSAGATGCFPGESGSVRTAIAVHLPGACVPWGYDMDVNLTLVTDASLPRPGVLRLELRASHEVDPGDVFVCGSLNAFLLSGAGVVIGGLFGWVGAVVGGILGGLAGGFGTMGAILAQPLPALNSPELTAIEGEDNAYFTELEIEPVTNRVLGTIAITRLVPCHDGLFGGGTLVEGPGIPALLPDGALVFPRWRQPGRSSCPEEGAAPSIVAELGFSFYRDAHPANIPLVTWNYEVLEADPPSGWPEPDVFTNPDTIAFRFHLSKHRLDDLRSRAATGSPRLKILYQSNFGARIFDMAVPASRLTDAEHAGLLDEVDDRCNANQALIDMFEDRTRRLRDILNGPRFIPDLELLDALWWTINFVGIDRRSKVRLEALQTNRALPIADLDLDGQGNGRIDMWLVGADIELPMQLATAALERRRHADDAGFMTGVKAYRRSGSVPVRSYVDHALVRNPSGLLAGVLTKTELLVYEIDAAGSSYMIHRLPADDVRSVGSAGGRLSYVSADGNRMISHDGRNWLPLDKDAVKSDSRRTEPQMPQRSARARATGPYALVFDRKNEALHLLEQVHADVGGFRYASGEKPPDQKPTKMAPHRQRRSARQKRSPEK